MHDKSHVCNNHHEQIWAYEKIDTENIKDPINKVIFKRQLCESMHEILIQHTSLIFIPNFVLTLRLIS